MLLDAIVPGVWTQVEVEKNLSAMRPQFDELRRQAPELAKVAIPFANAMPRIATKVNAMKVRENLPILDIVAEKGQTDPESARVWLDAHQRFDRGHPERSFLLAQGSSHKVMLDKPDLVADSILSMLKRLKG